METLELMMTALSETPPPPPPAGNIHAETDGGRDTERSSEKGEEREKRIFK